MTEKVEFYKETEFKDTEIGRIPKEWEVKKLDEIADPQRGLSYSGEEKSNTETADGYLFLTLNSIKEGGGLKEDGWTWIKSDRIKERHFVREGDIVIANTEQSKDGSLIGSPAIVHFPEWYKKDKAVYSHHISKLTLKVGSLDINFFYYYLCSTQPIARKYYTGTGVWGLKVDSWAKDLDVIIPPLSEQQQIASILSTIDEAIQKTDEVIAKTERLKRGMMRELLTKGIGHKEFKDTEIGRIPKEWKVVKLKEVAEERKNSFVDGPFGSDLKKEEFQESGIPVIQLHNIRDGVFVSEGLKYISEEKFASLERHETRPGDIVITKLGDPIAQAAVVPATFEKYMIVADCVRLRVNRKIANPYFVQYVINSVTRKSATAKAKGTTRKRINLTEIRELVIPLPTLEEQLNIVEILSLIQRELETVGNERAKLARLKQGFMNDLLSGRIRVRPK